VEVLTGAGLSPYLQQRILAEAAVLWKDDRIYLQHIQMRRTTIVQCCSTERDALFRRPHASRRGRSGSLKSLDRPLRIFPITPSHFSRRFPWKQACAIRLSTTTSESTLKSSGPSSARTAEASARNRRPSENTEI